jgi:plastocyanin
MNKRTSPVFPGHANFPALKMTVVVCAGLYVLGACTNSPAAESSTTPPAQARYFLPDAAASRIVSVSTTGSPSKTIIVQTEAVAVKETGPKPTIEHFGEVYAFSPAFIGVHREQPVRITLWNLQPDDEHDFMLEDRPGHALMHLRLAPLSKTSFVYRFHREGLFDFRCAVHQPEMNGQILVLPPQAE